MITRFGKRFMTSQLAGLIDFSSQDLAFGIDNTTPQANGNDTRLGFEFYRANCIFSTTNIVTDNLGNTTYGIIYTATIPTNISGIIKEIALYPKLGAQGQSIDSKFLSNFEDVLLWQDSGGFPPVTSTSPTSRIGDTVMRISAPQGASYEYYTDIESFNLLSYSGLDSIALAYNQADANLSTIKIKFYSSETSYHYMQFDCSSQVSGEYILTKNISEMQTYGTTTSTIIRLGVEITAKSGGTSATVYLDGLRINDEDTFRADYGMIARSLITYSTTISGTSGTNTITAASVGNLFIGQKVTGTGIGTNAVITAITNNTVTLSVNNTGTVSGVGTFYGLKKIAGRPVDIEYRLGLEF